MIKKVKCKGRIDTAILAQRYMSGDDMYIIPIDLEEEMPYKPGQFITITAKIDGEKVPRSYSILSGEGKRLEIYFNVVEAGKMTPWLTQAQDQVLDVVGPHGGMTIKHRRDKKVFISNGTGIAPFISMINQIIDDEYPITLLHSNKFESEANFHEHFSLLAEKYTNFTFMPTLTREKSEGFYEGRVTEWLEEVFDDKFETEYYICGLQDLVVNVESWLLEADVDLRHIITEKYC